MAVFLLAALDEMTDYKRKLAECFIDPIKNREYKEKAKSAEMGKLCVK